MRYSTIPPLQYSPTPILQHSISSNRQQDAKSGAFARLAFDFDSAAVGLNDHLGVEHSDANTLFLGGLKRSKQGVLNEIGAHPATVVADAQNHPAVPLAGFHSNYPARHQGFTGVKHQVRKDFLNLRRVQPHLGQRAKLLDKLHTWSLLLGFERVVDEFVQVAFDRLDGEFVTQNGEPADHVIDVGDGLGNTAQGVLPELRVLVMDRQILQHRREGGGSFLEVVKKKRGHGLEGLELFGLRQPLRQLNVQEAGGGLVADGFEEVQVLHRKRHAAHPISQGQDPQQLASGNHRHANAVTALAEFLRMGAPERDRPGFSGGVNVNRVGMRAHGGHDFRGVGGLERELSGLGLREGGRGGKSQPLFSFIHQPDGDGKGLENVRDELNDGAAQLGLLDAACGASGERPPYSAIVVNRSLEMAADKALRVQAHAVREQQHGQQDEREQDTKGFERESGIAAEEGDYLGKHPNNQQVGARQENGEGVMQQGVGGIDAHLEMAGAEEGARHQQAGDQEGAGIDRLLRERPAVKKEGLAAGVSAGDEQNAQAQNHEFDAPARGADGSAEGALEVHEDEHGAEQKQQVETGSGEAQPEQQVLSPRRLPQGDDDFVRESQGQDDGSDEGSGERVQI